MGPSLFRKPGERPLCPCNTAEDPYKNRALLRNSPTKIGLFARIPHWKPLWPHITSKEICKNRALFQKSPIKICLFSEFLVGSLYALISFSRKSVPSMISNKIWKSLRPQITSKETSLLSYYCKKDPLLPSYFHITFK